MFIICEDGCREPATFSMKLPADLAGCMGLCHTDVFLCQEHFMARLKTDEWRKVRKLYIPEENTNGSC